MLLFYSFVAFNRGLDALLCMFFLWHNDVRVSCNKLKSCELRQFIIILFSMRMHITSFVILQLANKHNLCIYPRMWCIITTYKSILLVVDM